MKWNKKHIICLVSIILVTALAVGGIALWLRESKLEQLQNEALAELDRNAGQYDEQSIVLYETSKAKAEELAKLYGAKLRITNDGKFATLTLPEGTTIRDVYAMDESRNYIDQMSADYHVQTSELTEDDEDGGRLPQRPQYPVSDTAYAQQTYLDYVNMGRTWYSYTGSGMTVAVIDTGIDTDHPEFAGKISEYSYNATEDKVVKDYNDWSLIEDEQGHGTAVTGVIAAAMDGSGIVGVAPDVEIIVIKAECDANGAFLRTSDLVFGLYYAIERDANVVNMSFGTYANENPFADPCRLAYDSDVICVAAAGNDATAALCWPAADEHVIGVGALDGWERAEYSNFGENVNLCAPGTTYTTSKGGGYRYMNGTSLASPIVAGALVLMQQNNPYMDFEYVTEVLYASCYDLGDLGRDWYFGFGALDVHALTQEERCTITYNMLTDELENQTGIFIDGHTLQELPEPERLYAVFDGWYYDDTFTQEYNYYEDKFYTEVTLYAKWVNEDDGVPYTYVILDDGTVEIRSYTGHRRYLTVPEKIEGRVVSSIGDFAFADQTRLREVTLPSGLKNIGLYAFQNCANLISIRIPEAVTQIQAGAFSGCVRLSTVAFAGSSRLETVGDLAFAGCSSLRSIELPASLRSVNGSAFFGATALYEIRVQQGNAAYQSAEGVLFDLAGSTLVAYPASRGSSYTLPAGTRHIGCQAFAFAKLKNIDLANVESVGEGAFEGAALEAVHIPDSVTMMAQSTFSKCVNLSQVTLGRGLTLIPNNAFLYCINLRQIALPSGIAVIGSDAFALSGLESIAFEEGSTLTLIGPSAFFRSPLAQIDVPSSVEEIGAQAFSTTPLTQVRFAENSRLRLIGGKAFSDCVSLESISLPESLEAIGDMAFQNAGLREVAIPASVTAMGDGPFSLCSNLTAVTVEAGNTVYHDIDGVVYTLDNTVIHTYPASKAGENYALQTTTQMVAPWAFAGSVYLNWVELPQGLTQICEYGFAYCDSLQNMNIPANVMQIGRYAFAYNWQMYYVCFDESAVLPRLSYGAFAYSGIVELRVPANVSTMAQGVFEGCRNLAYVTFAANSKLESISAYMFDGCSNLQYITFEPGSALTSIQAHGLEGMAELRSIDFGDAKLTNIDNFAFRFCENLGELKLPDTVKNIGRYAFYGCKNLSSMSISEQMEHIGSYAFLGTKDMELYFAGETLPAYLDENWDYDTKGYYTGISSVMENEVYQYAVLSSGKIAILKYLGTDTVLDLTKVDLGGEIIIIGGGAFKESSVQSIVLPQSLTAIQAEAFAHSRITGITIPANVTFIGREAFAYTDLSAVIFGENAKIDVIEQYAFEGTQNLTAVTLPASLTKLGTGVFLDSGLQSVVFEQDIRLEEIPQKAFANTKLTAVTLPDSVTLVNHNAFHNVQTLKQVHFGDKEGIRLMSNAFYNTGLEALHIPANVTYIGEYCFIALDQLTAYTVDENNPNYKAVDGLLLSKSGRKLIAVPAGRTGSLTVPASVEEIGYGAFEESKLSEVLFHEDANILTFGYRAFFKAENITTITIPKSVVSIDYYAFAYCENLKEVVFAEGNQLKGIYEGAFCGDINLESITVPDTIVEISEFAFYGCSKITQIPVADTQNLKGIYDYAFAYTGIGGKVVMPETLLDIGDYTFLGTKLESVTIPDANKKDLVIGIGAFESCNSLTEITLPFLGASYEDEQISWLGYIFGAGSYEGNGAYVPESLKTVTLTEGVTTLGWGAFAYCSNVETINVPHSVSALNAYAFLETTARYTLTNTITVYTGREQYPYFSDETCGSGLSGQLNLAEGFIYIGIFECPGLTGITIPNGVETVQLSYSNISELYLPDSVTSIYCPFSEKLQTVRLPATMETIPASAFANCTSLTSVELPETLKKIDIAAFTGCESLTEIRIPDGVNHIGEHAFSGCTSLGSITLPASLTTIEPYAFNFCTSMLQVINRSNLSLTFGSEENGCVAMYARWMIDRDGNKICLIEGSDASYVDTADGLRFLLENGEYTLLAYLGDADTVTLPLEIQGQSYHILNFRGGRHLILPEGMAVIDESAFEGNTTLESVVIPDSVAQIGVGAFRGCTGLRSVSLPASITTIQHETFCGCSNLEKVNIPLGVKEIQMRAFAGCLSLREINLPDGLEIIGYAAFERTALTTLRIPAALRVIEARAFLESTLETVEVHPENQYFTQLDGILYNREITQIYAVPSSVTHVKVPATVEHINSAFAYCTQLKSVTFEAGSNMRWIDSMAFAGCTALETIDWPENLEAIYYAAFYGCTALNEIHLPDTLQYLDSEVFWDCTGLTEVFVPASVTYISSASFTGCSNLRAVHVAPDNQTFCSVDGVVYSKDLTQIVVVPKGLRGSVTIPAGVTLIPNRAFDNCVAITEIVLPEGLTTIESYAFNACTSLQRMNIPDTVTAIETGAFFDCVALEEITLPNGLTAIEEYAFYGCESLKKIDIPDTVTVIGDSAFLSCHSLKTLHLPRMLAEIGSWAFSGCYELRYVDLPDGVVYIGENAFSSCDNLLWVTLPQSLQEIAYQAFSNCFALWEIRNYSNLPLSFGSLDYGNVAEHARVIVDRDGNRKLRDPDCVVMLHTTQEGLVFLQENDQYTLVAYLGEADTLTLPLTFNGCSYAIDHLDGIRHVILPEGMTLIPRNAFWGSSTLESVNIPNTVTYIENGAFAACPNLTSIVIPDSVTHIESWAFVDSKNLAEITIGEGLERIGWQAFHGTAFANDPANWKDGSLFLERYLLVVDENCTSYTVPADTLLIADSAFENCHQLKLLTTGLYDESVFNCCTNLETLVLTENHGMLGPVIPLTLKNIVLTESFQLDADYNNLFVFVADVTIFVETKEENLRWDDNYPGWSMDNHVIYGDDWIWANFYDREGNQIQSAPQKAHAVIRLPYVQDEAGYVFVGWDLDGDGVADSVPANSTVDVNAHALYIRVCVHEEVIDAAVAPTCTEIGLTEGKHCDLCGEVLIAQEEIPALGHSHEKSVVEATCTEDGTITYTCHCGDTYTEIIAAIGHNYSDVVTLPTCTEDGYTTHTCANCGDQYTSDIVKATGHHFVDGVCADCGAPEVELGDVNGDGRINARDARLLLRYLADMAEDGEICLEAADFNGDGRINARDARAILQKIAGIG